MIRKTWIINLLLAIAAMLFFVKAFQSWHHSGFSLRGESDGFIDNRFNLPEFSFNKKPEKEYEAVAAYNLFSPDRSEPKPVNSVKKPKSEKEKVLSEAPPPKFIEQNYILTGIMYQKEKARALLKAPVEDKKQDPVRWISVGDKLNEFTVSEIDPDRIVITNGAVKYGLPIHKANKSENAQAPMAQAGASAGSTRKTGEAPKVIDTSPQSGKNIANKTKSEDGDIIIDGNKKYKIVETPFGKSRIRID